MSQTRLPDEIIVVNNASTDETGAVAGAIPGVRVVNEPINGLVLAREAGRQSATSDILAYVDADCRVPQWLERIERRFERPAVGNIDVRSSALARIGGFDRTDRVSRRGHESRAAADPDRRGRDAS